MANQFAIETNAIEKEYFGNNGDGIHAVRGINLAVRQGEIYALLGPNGAGKTTTIGMLTTLIRPTGGQAIVAGYDVVAESAQVRRNIGITFQEIVVDADLTGRQVLDFHGRLYGLNRELRRRRTDELTSLVELDDAIDRKAASYSGGMKRRLELARGLLTHPTILFLDEPTQGLDPQNRSGIWRYIRKLRDEKGLTLLMTTHYMEEAEALADRVGVIDHGQMVVEGAPQELVRNLGQDVVTLSGNGPLDDFVALLRAAPYVEKVVELEQAAETAGLQIGVDNGDRRLADIINIAASCHFRVHEIHVNRPSLGDVFLAYTGHALRDE